MGYQLRPLNSAKAERPLLRINCGSLLRRAWVISFDRPALLKLSGQNLKSHHYFLPGTINVLMTNKTTTISKMPGIISASFLHQSTKRQDPTDRAVAIRLREGDLDEALFPRQDGER